MDPNYYERIYDSIPREIYMKEHWRPLIENEIEKYCTDKTVLDLGSGTGIYTSIINKYTHRVCGIDLTIDWIKYLKNKKKIPNVVLADAHQIPLKNKVIDVIVTTGLFEYINRDIVIKEMNRILVSKGFCIIFVPNKYSLYRVSTRLISKIIGTTHDQNEPSKKNMQRLFDDNGFELIHYQLNDGLIWLPNILDKCIGLKIYRLIEKIFGFFGENPFSNVMLFVIRKKK